jgi:cell division septation protein DedD
MIHKANGAILAGAGLLALATGGAALADVKAGVEAWGRGDYAAAVHQWEGPAAIGDPDAMFNLAQAYRLGRGVPQDMAKAEALYARAAAKGHLQAADTYGLMLFQDGRREVALPYIEDAARRGDPRSEYLLGIASFNGDIVPKDWVKAYALLSMANSQGLPQAASALAQMDQNIPLTQRQQAAALALEMQKQADAARGRELAAADLGGGVSPGSRLQPSSPVRQAPAPPARVAVSPSVAAALAAVAQARQATGTESPADAGASFARRSSAPQLASNPPRAAAARPQAPAPASQAGATAPSAKPKPAAPAQVASADGPWRVQLGAFAVRGNADRLWSRLSGRGELAGKAKLTVPAGGVTKLQAGGFASRDAAEEACRSLQHSGQECLVTR